MTYRNTRFDYLYRDGSNYKEWGSVVFSGEVTPELDGRVRATLSDVYFIAGQVGVPELFLWTEKYPVTSDDHCWHEFSAFEVVDEPVSDARGRTIEQFVLDMEAAHAAGWAEFDPLGRKECRT